MKNPNQLPPNDPSTAQIEEIVVNLYTNEIPKEQIREKIKYKPDSIQLKKIILAQDILAVLPSHTRLKIIAPLANSNQDPLISSEIITSRVAISDVLADVFPPENHFCPANSDFEYESVKDSKWLRDHGIIDSVSNKLIIPFSIHSDDKEMNKFMDSMSQSLGLEVVNAPFDFTGGNILFNGNHVFIGEDEIRKSIPSFFESKEKALESIGEFFQKEVQILGASEYQNTAQEVFHLDLCVTFLGDKQVSVADIDIFNNLLGSRSYVNDIINALDLAMFNEEQYYEKKIPSILSPTGVMRDSNHCHEVVSDSIYELHKDAHFKIDRTRRYLNGIAEKLSGLGYEVIRTPFIPSLSEKIHINGAHISYNNSIVENFSNKTISQKNIYMMRFGAPLENGRSPNILQLMDLTAQETYESVGFKVLWLDAGVRNAPELGFLHCLTLEKRKTS